MTSIVILTESPILSIGLQHYCKEINASADIVIVATANELLSAVTSKKVDVAIVSTRVGFDTAVETLRRIRAISEGTRFVVIAPSMETRQGLAFYESGVDAFLSESMDERELSKALEQILSGRKFLSSDILEELLRRISHAEQPFNSRSGILSKRESEVAKLLATGLGTRDISLKLKIQSATISTVKRRIFTKLKVDNILQLSEKLKEDLFI